MYYRSSIVNVTVTHIWFKATFNSCGVFSWWHSGAKTSKNFGRWGSLKDRKIGSYSGQNSGSGTTSGGSQNTKSDSELGVECVQTFQRASLYILGDKAQTKVIYFKVGFDFDIFHYNLIYMATVLFIYVFCVCLWTRIFICVI